MRASMGFPNGDVTVEMGNKSGRENFPRQSHANIVTREYQFLRRIQLSSHLSRWWLMENVLSIFQVLFKRHFHSQEGH